MDSRNHPFVNSDPTQKDRGPICPNRTKETPPIRRKSMEWEMLKMRKELDPDAPDTIVLDSDSREHDCGEFDRSYIRIAQNKGCGWVIWCGEDPEINASFCPYCGLRLYGAPCETHCSVCEGADHHWMPESDDEINDGEPFMVCKHCSITRPMLDGEGDDE